MSVGRIWHDQQFRYTDPKSGREVVRLTNYLGHSHHLYFTDPCWIEDNRKFIFTSDRENKGNLFSYDLATGEIVQLTDLPGTRRPTGVYSKANRKHYFWYGRNLQELDVDTLELKVLYEAPAGFVSQGTLGPTADGRYVCTLLVDQAAFPPATGISYAYHRFVELFEMKPLTRIIRIDTATGQADVIHEDRCYMGHINTSPTQPHLLTFCHEGPWARVEQRIWGLNINTGECWMIRPQHGEVSLGHEYWFADGIHIGYHGFRRKDRTSFFGFVRWDGAEQVEFDFPYHSTHFCSNDSNLMAGDGTSAFAANAKPYIMLFKREGDAFVGPRILAFHRSTFNNQHAHPHPRFSPDGKHVMYSSDLTDYSNIYWVEVGDFYDLPELKD